MNHVTCTLVPNTNTVFIWRDGNMVGMVTEGQDDDPQIDVYGQGSNYVGVLTFGDLEIVQDNWNQLQEMRREQGLKKGEKIEFPLDGDNGL